MFVSKAATPATARTVADALVEARPTAADRFQQPLARPAQSRALQETYITYGEALLPQNCTFDSMTEGYDYATELTSSLHCEDPSCRQNLATSMSRNYEETWGYPFNESISTFAISCWCEGNLGVMSHGAVVIDTFAEMHATCRDQECRAVKAHTLEGAAACMTRSSGRPASSAQPSDGPTPARHARPCRPHERRVHRRRGPGRRLPDRPPCDDGQPDHGL